MELARARTAIEKPAVKFEHDHTADITFRQELNKPARIQLKYHHTDGTVLDTQITVLDNTVDSKRENNPYAKLHGAIEEKVSELAELLKDLGEAQVAEAARLKKVAEDAAAEKARLAEEAKAPK